MAQLTIYLPDKVEKEARRAARKDGKSVSRWIADKVVHHLEDVWPAAVIAAAGAIPDFPAARELRHGYGADVRRERFE